MLHIFNFRKLCSYANMFLLYILGICLAVNSSHIARIDQVSCSRYEYAGSIKLTKNELIPIEQIDRKEEELVRLEIIKQKILKKLGLGRIPQVDEKVTSKIANDQLFNILEDEQEDAILRSRQIETQQKDQTNDRIPSLVNDEPINQVYVFPIKSRDESKFLFNLTISTRHNTLGGLEQPKNFILTLRKKSKDQPDDKCTISVHKLIDAENFDNSLKIGILDESNYKSQTNALLRYNFNALMHDLSKTDVQLRPIELFVHFDTMNCLFDSAMVTIEYEIVQKERSRRSIDCAPNGQSGCCREPFYVDFKTIGWANWVIEPAGYNAYYCHGKCDLSHARYHYTTMSYQFPTIITQCCSPANMSSISLIYVDESNYVFKKNLPNMVVERCDCA